MIRLLQEVRQEATGGRIDENQLKIDFDFNLRQQEEELMKTS
jgi:hypothetical protein